MVVQYGYKLTREKLENGYTIYSTPVCGVVNLTREKLENGYIVCYHSGMDKDESEKMANLGRGVGYITNREKYGRTSIRVPYGVYERIKRLSEKEGTSMGQVVAARFQEESEIISLLNQILTAIKEQ